MNILVVREDGSYTLRPDTTLERESRDFYLPDDCVGAVAGRCTYIRLKKAGKAVGTRFADRYFEGCSDGLLLYGVIAAPGPDGVPLVTPYIDCSTFLNPEMRQPDESEHRRLAEALSIVTRHTSVRIGDILCLESSDFLECPRGGVIDGVSVI